MAGIALCVIAMGCAITAAQPLPKLTAPVNDFAHIISPDAAAALDQRIRALQAASGDVVVVATVQTFAPFGSIEEYAVKLFEEAGIGQKDAHNGVLIVLAVEERRVRIEVGYGLEEFIPDGFAGDIIRQTMLPAFRAGDYSAGLLAGTTRIIQRIAERRGVTLPDVPAQEAVRERRSRSLPAGLIILIVILALIVLRSSSRPSSRFHRRGPWGPTWSGWSGGVGGFGGGGFGGGGGAGGFGGFGGGRSGGGGASGGW